MDRLPTELALAIFEYTATKSLDDVLSLSKTARTINSIYKSHEYALTSLFFKSFIHRENRDACLVLTCLPKMRLESDGGGELMYASNWRETRMSSTWRRDQDVVRMFFPTMENKARMMREPDVMRAMIKTHAMLLYIKHCNWSPTTHKFGRLRYDVEDRRTMEETPDFDRSINTCNFRFATPKQLSLIGTTPYTRMMNWQYASFMARNDLFPSINEEYKLARTWKYLWIRYNFIHFWGYSAPELFFHRIDATYFYDLVEYLCKDPVKKPKMVEYDADMSTEETEAVKQRLLELKRESLMLKSYFDIDHIFKERADIDTMYKFCSTPSLEERRNLVRRLQEAETRQMDWPSFEIMEREDGQKALKEGFYGEDEKEEEEEEEKDMDDEESDWDSAVDAESESGHAYVDDEGYLHEL